MGNLSYCRFENTATALQDCIDAVEELMDHNGKDHYGQPLSTSEKVAFEVLILDKNKDYYKFQWIVEKYSKEGRLKDCWLTTSVSNPISLGSST